MKINNIIFWVLGLAVAATSCAINEPVDGSELPEGAYIRLNFSSDAVAIAQKNATKAAWSDPKGSGNLTFNWETVGIDSEETKKLALVISDGAKALSSKAPSQEQATTHSGLAVTPREGDAHYANFQSVGYYATSDLRNAKYCFAVSGNPTITENASGKKHVFQFPEMPSTFTQPTNQDPSFLRDYMYMYSTTTYNANGNTLSFNNIPATFRVVVSNATANALSLEEIYVSLSHISGQASSSSANIQDWDDSSMDILQMAVEEGAIASKNSTVTYNWENGSAQLAFGDDSYSRISVATGSQTTVAPGEKYTAYAMVLPLNDNNAFKGKTINFSIKGGNHEQIAFQLTGSKLAAINGSGNIYNWVSGKSYTIRLNLGADGKVTGEVEADKTIRVESNETKPKYILKYEDASGTPLTEYADICELTVDEVAYYTDFIDVNVAPREAETIGIYDLEGVRQGTILLSHLKPDYFEEPLYSFGLLSDVHIGQSASVNAESDFKRALNFFKDKGAALTCICGDITENGSETELLKYEQAVLEVSSANVFTTTGNHDCKQNYRQGIDPQLWMQYTRSPLVFEYSVERNGNIDHFLFLGMSYWYNGFSTAYLDSHITWLESKLEEYRNERCFVITHLFFPSASGNMGRIYPEDNWLSGAQLERLWGMCANYVNSIWFSGHSHWEWGLQKYEDKSNVYRVYNGTEPSSGWCVHVPSCGVPSTSDGVKGSVNQRVGVPAGSEGALVQVYENHIDILGRDFNSGKYLPVATYRLDTTPKSVAPNETPKTSHYIKASDFVVYKDQGQMMSVHDVEGTDYVDVIFTTKEQGYFVTNSTFYQGLSHSVSLTVEDVLCWTNWDEKEETGTFVTSIEKVGFYSGQYHLSSTNACYVNSANGVQFQTSSESASNIYPVKIRLKAQMVFDPAADGNQITPKHYLTAANFTVNEGKPGGIVRDSEDENYIEFEFSDKSQGFYVKNDTFTLGLDNDHGQKVTIIVEDAIAYEKNGNNWVEYPIDKIYEAGKVGFYSGKYHLESTTGLCYVNAARGVQFHTKSDYPGNVGDEKMPKNLKLKMKVRMIYYSTKATPDGYYLNEKHFISYKGEGHSVRSLGNNTIEINFTDKRQGWHIVNDLQGTKTHAAIQVDELKIWVGQSEELLSSISDIGFRDAQNDIYFLETRETYVSNAEGSGLEFQSSSDYQGEFPVKIQMKVAMMYY